MWWPDFLVIFKGNFRYAVKHKPSYWAGRYKTFLTYQTHVQPISVYSGTSGVHHFHWIGPLGRFSHHCESWEGLWLQEEAALQMHSFRDADPQPVIPQNPKKIMEYPPNSWDQAYTSAWPPLTLVYLALHGNKAMSGTPEQINLYLEIQHNNLSSL